jgi:hypothetical protein
MDLDINWKEVFRYAPLNLLWGSIIDPFFIEGVLNGETLIVRLHWVSAFIFWIATLALFFKYRGDKKFFWNSYISTLLAFFFYFFVVAFEAPKQLGSLPREIYAGPLILFFLVMIPGKLIESYRKI